MSNTTVGLRAEGPRLEVLREAQRSG